MISLKLNDMNDKIKQLNQYIMDLQMTEDNFNMLKEFVIDFNNEDNIKSFIFLDDKSTYYGGRNITQKKKVA
tara:strand:- start:161 stop:376 length:216 start_codon:yes stop_codon:yes gene_type:complete